MKSLEIGERVVVIEHGEAYLASVVSPGDSSSLLFFQKRDVPYMLNSDGNAWIGNSVIYRLEKVGL